MKDLALNVYENFSTVHVSMYKKCIRKKKEKPLLE